MSFRNPVLRNLSTIIVLLGASCATNEGTPPSAANAAGESATAGSTATPTAGASSGAPATSAQAGSAGAGTSATAGAGGSSVAGTGGGGAGNGGSAGGGGTLPLSCDGHAVSFNANTGAGNDPAKARVEVDFGADSPDLPVGNATRTIEFWAYVLTSSWSGDTNTTFFYGTNNRVADGFGLDFGGPPGTIDPFTNAIFDNDNQPTGLDATKDQWVHFAMTWDGTSVRAFVNGVEKANKTSSEGQKTLMTGRTPLIIGSYPSNYFNGAIDELRVWNVARSAAELTASMKQTLVGNEPGLTAYFKFDETSGTMAADSVTTAGHVAHPGVLMAASPAQLPTWIPGVPLACP